MPVPHLTPEQKLEVKRAKLKRASQLRAQLSFQHALERIDHRLDVVQPAEREIEARAAQGEIPRETS